MKANCLSATILLAEDDEDDVILIRHAFEHSKLADRLHVVFDGLELMDYLLHRGKFSDPNTAPVPDLILLDLNMPKMDGRQALKAIKEHPRLKHIPTVILTTSHMPEDILQTYLNGANSFISKPVTFDSMCEIIHKCTEYWFQVVKLPDLNNRDV